VGNSGALGAGGGGDTAEPVSVVAVSDAVAVSAGYTFTCAARKSGASCWGNNETRQLGVGDASPPSSVSSPVPVVGLSAPTQVSAGGGHACALLPGGKISCWGGNAHGRLGRGTRIYSASPVKVSKLADIKQVALGSSHGCAVTGAGALSCWGNNNDGQLAGAPIAATGTPTPIASLASGVTQATGGDYHGCAMVGGQVRCWGYGYYGTLGQGKFEGSETPVVFGAGPATDVSAGYHFTCALLSTTEVACAGLGSEGRLGQPGGNLNVPGKVVLGTADGGGPTYLTGVSKLSSNGGHSCVLTGTAVRCWGFNESGECGTTGSGVPAPFLVALPPAKDVSTGGGHSCALLTDGSVRCWGSADYGQLGSGTGGGPNPQPAVDFGGKTVKAIALGESHSCALSDDGSVYCWGRGRYGQVGNGVRADAPRPTLVTGLSGVVSIAAHGDTSCAVLADGTAQCWGSNHVGQLGDGGEFVAGTPASVVGY
jgi:alpha-tubulin suppressor-like RCC1 family protein